MDEIDRPENLALCTLFAGWSRWPEIPALMRADDSRVDLMGLGVHPDLISRLWDELTVMLPRLAILAPSTYTP